MSEYPEVKDATPEQKQEVLKVLSKARWKLAFIGFKTFLVLFSANCVCTLASLVILKESEVDTQNSFKLLCIILNSIFVALYLNGQLKANSAIVIDKIKEILKKSA